MKKLSIVIPVYNEQENIPLLYENIVSVLKENSIKNHEIIFIDDGSRDNSFQVIERINKENKHVKSIQFRKNLGKSQALTAGFKMAFGDIIITMDGDNQDDPREIPRFIEKIEDGLDLVNGWKYNRKDPLKKIIPSKIFNLLSRSLIKIRIHDFNCGFKAYRKEAAKCLSIKGDFHRYIPAIVHWNGFRVGEMKVRHHPRRFGKSKYNMTRFIKGFLDLMIIKYLTSSNHPLHLFGTFGIVFFLIGAAIGSYILYVKLILGQFIGAGRPLVVLTALAIIAGIQLFSIGLIGELILGASSLRKDDENPKKNYIKRIIE